MAGEMASDEPLRWVSAQFGTRNLKTNNGEEAAAAGSECNRENLNDSCVLALTW